MSSDKLTATQEWSQVGMAFGVASCVAIILYFSGAKAPWAAIPAVGLWATPWIEKKTTGKRPHNLATRQCSAIGATIAYVVFELTRW